MKLKLFQKPLLLSFFSLCTLHLFHAAAETNATEATPQVTTEASKSQQWEYPKTCYIEKSKADYLLTIMNNTVQIFNQDDKDFQCDADLRLTYLDSEDITCTDDRITRIQEDLVNVAGTLFKFATRKLDPSPDETIFWELKMKKLRLIHDLFALNVFYGPSPCKSSSSIVIVRYPLLPLVLQLDGILENVFRTVTTYPTFQPANSMPALLTYPAGPASATTVYGSTTTRQQYCTGEISSERSRIFGLFEQRTKFLQNALESEMTLFGRTVPNFKLVSTVNESSRYYEMDQQLDLTSPPQCNVNASYFNQWNDEINDGLKFALQLDKRRKIRLPSEAATCVAILKVAHSAVSAVKAAVGNPIYYAECAQLKSLRGVVSAVKRLVEQFGQQHWQQMTEPHKAHWKSILSNSADLEDIVDCLKTTKYESENDFNCIFPDSLRIPEYETDVEADDDGDATWYTWNVEEQRI